MVVTIAPGKQACTNQQSRWYRTSAACRYLTQGLFFIFVETLNSVSFFCIFYPSIQLPFSEVCTLIRHSVTKFPVISSVQYTLPFITSFFEGMFSQSMNFYENDMILWYFNIRSKVVWILCMVHGLMDPIPRTKTKTLSLRKLRVCYFFHAVNYSKNYVIPHPVCYCCHLERHLIYFTTLENNNNMPVKFSKHNRKLSDIVTNCEFDFRLNFALNGSHLGHHLHYFNLVNQSCECFILIVCIIMPLNIDKKSQN